MDTGTTGIEREVGGRLIERIFVVEVMVLLLLFGHHLTTVKVIATMIVVEIADEETVLQM